MDREWKAFYYDGQSAKKHPVVLRLSTTSLRIHMRDGSELCWPWEEIRQTQGGYAREHVRLERGGELGEALVVTDPGFVPAVREQVPEARLTGPRSPRAVVTLVAAAAVGTVAMAAGLYLWGIPAIASAAAMTIPTAWEDQLGQAVVDNMVPSGDRCSDPESRQAVEAIVETLVATRKSPYTYRVLISKSGEVNAFAAPGGHVVVCRGLLKKTRRPEELAGVLAHEIQHVEQRHGTKAIFRELSLSLIVASMTGDAGSLAKMIDTVGKLGGLGLQRRDEEEADREGMRMMLAAELDPAGMVGAFKVLEEASGDLPRGLEYLSSHPNTGDRVQALAAMAAGATYQPRPIRLARPWGEVNHPCD